MASVAETAAYTATFDQSSNYGQQIGQNFGSITNVFNAHASEHEALEGRTRACLKAFFLSDPKIDRENILSEKGRRTEGTCTWIKSDEAFTAWLDGAFPIFSISGGPGKGKTMLSLFLVEELESLAQQNGSTILLFFFCSAQDENRNTATAILRSLISQIIHQHQELAKYVLPYAESPEKLAACLASVGTLWHLFVDLIEAEDLDNIFCVLDGLDECESDSRRLFLERLVDYSLSRRSQSARMPLRLIIISRAIPGLDGIPNLQLDTPNSSRTANDIGRVIAAGVTKLSKLEGFTERMADNIRNILHERSEGTFLWVGMVLKQLLEKTTCTEVFEALRDLPRGLPAAYGRMMLQIEPARRPISALMLRWVTLASRPLSLQEMATVLGLRPLEYVTIEQQVRDQVTICKPLLELQQGQVTLVHQSARDYLMRKEPDINPALEEFRIQPQQAHFEIALSCLGSIQNSPLQNQPLSPTSKELWPPLLSYSLLGFLHHAQRCPMYASQLLDMSQSLMDKKLNLRSNWWQTCCKVTQMRYTNLPLCHIAAFYGIDSWVASLSVKKGFKLKMFDPVNQKDSNGRTPLMWASQGGHQTTVQMLLNRDASVKMKDEESNSAVTMAAIGGHESIVQLLLDRGANINIRDGQKRSLLTIAASMGHESVVQLLLDHGIQVDTVNNNGGALVLTQAASQGHETVVKLLLDRGVAVDATHDDSGITALFQAASRGYEPVTKMLLARGANVNARDNDGGDTALTQALRRGSEAVASLLLDHGADVHVMDAHGKTPLIIAAAAGHEGSVKTLLEHGIDIHERDRDGYLPLIRAAESGRLPVVELLLKAGADVNEKAEDGASALNVAVEKEHMDIVRLLLDCGAVIDVTSIAVPTLLPDQNNKNDRPPTTQRSTYGDKAGWIADYRSNTLACAAIGGNKSMLNLLLQRGRNISTAVGTIALMIAVEEGSEGTVRKLLEYGIDPNSFDDDGLTALHHAARRGRVTAVKLLLHHGAHPNATGAGRATPLHYAVREGYETVVQVLGKAGANLNAQNAYGFTALSFAARFGNKRIVELLLFNGANMNIEDEFGWLPIRHAVDLGNEEIVKILSRGTAPPHSGQR